jgi:3-hydroxyacyl-CoA dehydrogenase
MDIKKVLIVGSGTLGQQIGFQCATHGFDANDDDRNPSLFRHGR